MEIELDDPKEAGDFVDVEPADLAQQAARIVAACQGALREVIAARSTRERRVALVHLGRDGGHLVALLMKLVSEKQRYIDVHLDED